MIPLDGEGPLAGSFAFQSWGVEQGLPQVSVTDLAQDDQGLLLVSTFGGAARFDGVRFRVLDPTSVTGLAGVRFTSVAVGPDGRTYLGGQYGTVSVLDGTTATQLPGFPQDGGAGVVWDLLPTSDSLWAATTNGLFQASWDGRIRREPGSLHTLFATDEGVWLGADQLTGPDGTKYPVWQVTALDQDRDGRIWALSSQGVFVVDGGRVDQVAQRSTWLGSLAIDARDRVWVGNEVGLEILGTTSRIGPEPLASWTQRPLTGVRSLLVDREQNLWVGTDRDGLVRVTEMPYTRHLAGRAVNLVDTGSEPPLATVGCGGLVLADGVTYPGSLGPCGTTSLGRAPDGELWVADEQGVGPVDAPRFLLPARVLAMVWDRSGRLWLGTDGAGIWSVSGDDEPQRLHEVPELVVPVIAVAPNGEVWFGLPDGAAVWSEQGVRRLGAEGGLPRAQVRAIAFRGDATWLGTYGGGLIHVGPGLRATVLERRHGLPESIVSALVDDGEGHAWVNGNRGVARLPWADLEAAVNDPGARVRARRFVTGEANGGASPSGGLDARGHVWFTTLDGLVEFDPATIDADAHPPPLVVVESLEVDRAVYAPSAGLHIPPGSRNLTVRLTSSTLALPELARFEVRLSPGREAWQDLGEARSLTLTSLEPGAYTLEARVTDGWGRTSEPIATGFVLEGRFFELPWVKVTLRFLVLAAIGLYAGSRLRAARRRNAELQAEIRERQSLVAGLRTSEAHWRSVFRAATDALVVLDARGALLEVNPAAATLFGAPEADLVGRRWADLVGEPGVAVRTDGSRVRVREGTVELGDGRRLATLTDLTPLLDLQHRLTRAERLEAVGRLAGGVAHDFNNLLMVVKGNATELAEDGGSDPEPVQHILDAVERGATLTRHLLAFGQRQMLRPEVVDLARLLYGLHHVLGRLLPANIELQVKASARCNVLVDPAQLELVVTNLALHGAESMREGGVLHMDAAFRGEGFVRARWGLPEGCGAQVVLEVTDHGPGLAPRHVASLFEPFSEDGHRALGLASVHGFVAQSRGHIFVRSELGRGTTFEVLLPATDAELSEDSPPTAATPAPVSERSGEGIRVLVCDDEPTVLRAIKRLLGAAGYQVRQVTDGEAALAELERDLADVLVTDVLMPGMNGFELARAARQRWPNLAIVFVSGYTREIDTVPTEGPLLQKPFERSDLENAIRRAQRMVNGTGRAPSR